MSVSDAGLRDAVVSEHAHVRANREPDAAREREPRAETARQAWSAAHQDEAAEYCSGGGEDAQPQAAAGPVPSLIGAQREVEIRPEERDGPPQIPAIRMMRPMTSRMIMVALPCAGGCAPAAMT